MDTIVGSPPDIDWEKADVVRETMRRLGLTEDDKSTILMIGDRKFDILGAKECGIDGVGVEFFGYAAPGELAEAGAVAVVQTTEELEQFILNH
jgi:phosphoglycolate phosphatase